MELNKEHKGLVGIYSIVNKVNGKRYVGKSIDIYRRISQHITSLYKESKDENRYLISAWKKYGRESFVYEVLETVEFNEATLKEKELFWIDHYRSCYRGYGYNLRRDSSSKMIVHEETRKLLSIATKRRFEDIELRKEYGIRSSKFWKENPEVKEIVRGKVSEIHRKYNIVQLDLNDNIIREYKGRHEIVNDFKDLSISTIMSVCNGGKTTYKGFKWRYRDLSTGEILPGKEKVIFPVSIDMYTMDDVYMRTFSSPGEAAIEMNIPYTIIVQQYKRGKPVNLKRYSQQVYFLKSND